MINRRLGDSLLKPFTRVTSSGRYVPEVDGLRCLAIVLVIFFHCHHLFRTGNEPVTSAELTAEGWAATATFLPNFFFAKGWFGVQIFFVISGMVLALPFASHYLQGADRPKVKDYFRRRLIRIEVPYIITLTFFLFYAVTFQDRLWNEMLPRYFAGLIYSHSLIYDGALNPLLWVSWTLEIEIQFYLLAPLLCTVFKIPNTLLRRGILLLAILFIEPCVDAANAAFPSVIWRESILNQFSYFFAGILLADLYLSPKLKAIRANPTALIWDAIGLLAWPATFLLLEFPPSFNLKPLTLILAFLAVLTGPVLRKLFSNRWVVAVGMMCYTIYLFHNFFIYSILQYFIFSKFIVEGDWPWNLVLMALMLVGCLILSGLLFLVVEKPFAKGKLPRLFKRSSKPSPDCNLDSIS
ncbi:MAG: acyltransferase [Akkermansiaceae bacterium]|nr:acyltransferase [Akkermansiaceae bacterium]